MARMRGAARFVKALADPSLPPTRVIPFPYERDQLRLAAVARREILAKRPGSFAGARSRPAPVNADEAPASIDWGAYFDPAKPLEVDIGCGKGRFVLARARKNRDVQYLGVERELSRINFMDYTARREGMTNFRPLRADGQQLVERLLPAGSVRAAYFFFPDPWPKRKHHVHRLFKPEFADGVWRVLSAGGCFHVATDQRDYHEAMVKALDADARFERIETLVRENDEKTDFELIFQKKGLSVYGASYRKK